ncbi:YqgE/AlgH family protein [soil metagenome]
MITPGRGTLLIANPFLKDPNFIRTVVFICEHNAEGTFGFVLNKLFPKSLNEVVPDLAGYTVPVYYGGPVQRETVHFIHQYPDLIPGGEQIFTDVYWGGNFETLLLRLKNNDLDLNKIKFFIGYSGWAASQLDGEMEEKTWLTVDATEKLVFHPESENIWKNSLKEMGGEYEMMINFPIDPQLN